MPDALPPPLRGNLAGALQSPHELRVESRTAIPRLAAFLAERHGVEFAWRTAALGLERGVVHTARGAFRAPRIILAPGANIVSLAPEVFERRAVALVVDDSHHHAPTPDPFQLEARGSADPRGVPRRPGSAAAGRGTLDRRLSLRSGGCLL